MKKLMTLFLSTLLVLSFTSCGDDDDDNNLNTTKTVTITIDGSDNLNIDIVTYVISTGVTESFSDINQKTWSKQITYEGVLTVTASGMTTDNQKGNMSLRLMDGSKVLKESKSEGSILVTTIGNY